MAAIATLCNEHRVPLVPRGAGTGYTGGSVPTRGGVVLSLERMNRILEIDEANLLAVVEPNVITGDLQDAVEKVGLFYPPDPASLRQSRARRQRRGVRRRPARLQVRHDEALRARPRGGASDRGDRQDRRQDGEERRRLRPDAAARRARKARWRSSRRSSSAWCQAAGIPGDAARDVRHDRGRGRRGGQHHAGARGARRRWS